MPSTQIISIIFPIFGLVGVGWLARRFDILKKHAALPFNNFVYYIALPFLILRGVLGLDKTDLLNGKLIGTNILALVILTGLALLVTKYILRRNTQIVAMFVIASYLGNVAYMGIPVNELAYGKTGGGIASLVAIIVIVYAILIGLTTLRAVSSEKHDFKFKDAIVKILKLPMIWAVIAGVVLVFSNITLPESATSLIDMFARVAGPLALFSMGMFLHENKLGKNYPTILVLALFNLLLLPLSVFASGLMFGLDELPLKVSIIQAGMPIAVTAFVFSHQFHIQEKLISQAIVFTVLLSPITLSLLLWLVEFI